MVGSRSEHGGIIKDGQWFIYGSSLQVYYNKEIHMELAIMPCVGNLIETNSWLAYCEIAVMGGEQAARFTSIELASLKTKGENLKEKKKNYLKT